MEMGLFRFAHTPFLGVSSRLRDYLIEHLQLIHKDESKG